ncbi:MAG: hypothetical protein A3F82_07200 [Deltaproteobacteria bacterium RIFCSPLOWO2_12_FULL_44_12]|nr:MAG: hypothetical protein A2712_10035 [Deltaproteobacteria bacterium RIFCSPHIGHO2_01_FULL_43_49]OGQ15449.1 MAG: hypothetical protein A3D22_10565 [Deltaproteobacteria bacterium RIFCSPHIGHO2_02_FULL_44_53]OGQ29642.1 MAG: hypothetical protein A3D98_10765 [Deltaproteobacteria bacterium RIFCSPHIGHO2_12_FULL_44_21]OGQ32255.1 MAG: hypothetical protein A2979_00410 [Deltaproteobacteria bacterium RIFCSPLOWO2_01_FULL_45_74]OGQ43898.1 MAG: hypothetical protein A3I70_04310 [Deltaproteobacteria bacterium 
MKRKNFRLKFQTLSDFQYLIFLTKIFKAFKIDNAFDLTQILVEAFSNAVIHGHKGKKEKWIDIDLHFHSKKTAIRIVDSGKGFNLQALKEQKNKWQTHGRGLTLIRAKADRMTNHRKKDLHIFEAQIHHG